MANRKPTREEAKRMAALRTEKGDIFTEMEKIIERTRDGEGSLADLEEFEAIIIGFEEQLDAFANATAPAFESEIATARKGIKDVKKGIDQMKQQMA